MIDVFLRTIQQAYRAAGRKAAAGNIARTLKHLESGDKMNVDEFAGSIKSATVQPVPKRAAPREVAIDRHVKSLGEAGLDKSAFDAALAALKADRKVRKVELEVIAGRYTGFAANHRSRAAALTAISRKFMERARMSAELGSQKNVKPW